VRPCSWELTQFAVSYRTAKPADKPAHAKKLPRSEDRVIFFRLQETKRVVLSFVRIREGWGRMGRTFSVIT
jgi:hypothetical protein